ncbi:hypothetical protein BAQU_1969 [Bifidobacterium aquikefiri]|uniref:Uncharacterized protein n=1 Tax=Bifidobacterium aquikefiri TaxID=1653207 RepID=A0A261G0C5_9BIFI|nr:hypothetical protein BAQU_1961 [Bifidobacterium aquikefiri]OZG64894.1 hypothetical protein BAQU_1969 [Bifidobacterium aquikefiri]
MTSSRMGCGDPQAPEGGYPQSKINFMKTMLLGTGIQVYRGGIS